MNRKSVDAKILYGVRVLQHHANGDVTIQFTNKDEGGLSVTIQAEVIARYDREHSATIIPLWWLINYLLVTAPLTANPCCCCLTNLFVV